MEFWQKPSINLDNLKLNVNFVFMANQMMNCMIFFWMKKKLHNNVINQFLKKVASFDIKNWSFKNDNWLQTHGAKFSTCKSVFDFIGAMDFDSHAWGRKAIEKKCYKIIL